MSHSSATPAPGATAETGSATARPIAGAEFARAMAPLGPFGRHPRLAVAVSGGADSTALAVLAHAWAGARGGAIEALIVDHGLRPESAAEAARVAGRLAGLGITASVLRWEGPRRATQAAARAARHRLLGARCTEAGIAFLLLGHHRDDQAETVLMRLARGSGLDGLAAMPVRRETAEVAVLRPLLAVPGARLRATLRARGLGWEEDPSNRDPAFARVRLRHLLATLSPEGLSGARLASTAQALGRARAALEGDVLALLAAAVRLDPAGYAVLDPGPWGAAPAAVAGRALARVLMCVGGRRHPPRSARLDRLVAGLAGEARARTLGGCRLMPWRGRLLICREVPRSGAVQRLEGAVHWDGRFVVASGRREGSLAVRALGADGWAALVAARPAARRTRIPYPARLALPAVFDLDGLFAVPHLGFVRGCATALVTAAFRPHRPLGPPVFAFVEAQG